MDNCKPLLWYGVAVLIVTAVFVIVPYLRRKSELISAWNIFLLGIAIFIGIGSIEAATSQIRFSGMQWFQPTKEEVSWYLAAVTVFLITLFAAYYYDPFSKSVAARSFNKWPPDTTVVYLTLMLVCLLIAAVSQLAFLYQITFVRELLINVSHKAFVFSCLFSFVLWYRNRANLLWLCTFIVVFLGMCLLAMLAAHGRRLLLSVLAVPIFVIYYQHARYWRPTRSLVIISIGAMSVFVLNLMYSSFRHFDLGKDGKERTAATILEQVKNIGSSNWLERFMDDSIFHFSQQLVHYSLLTDHLVRTNQLEPRPFNTFKMIAAYPIPRRIWENKPQVLGVQIVQEVSAIPIKTTNWGCGVAGHAAYEGGLGIAALFAYMAVFMVRMIDDPLRRQPRNVFLIGILAAASPHLLAWTRGDLAVMTLEVAECMLFVLIMSMACRFLFGTQCAASLIRLGDARIPSGFRIPAR